MTDSLTESEKSEGVARIQLCIEREFEGSKEDFAEACGVSQKSVYRWLNEEKYLSAESAIKVSSNTDIDLEELYPGLL